MKYLLIEKDDSEMIQAETTPPRTPMSYIAETIEQLGRKMLHAMLRTAPDLIAVRS